MWITDSNGNMVNLSRFDSVGVEDVGVLDPGTEGYRVVALKKGFAEKKHQIHYLSKCYDSVDGAEAVMRNLRNVFNLTGKILMDFTVWND